MARSSRRYNVPPARTVGVRLLESTLARAEALVAAVPGLTSLSKILGRAVELGLAGVESELAGAVQGEPVHKGGNGTRADVGTSLPGDSLR